MDKIADELAAALEDAIAEIYGYIDSESDSDEYTKYRHAEVTADYQEVLRRYREAKERQQ